MAGTMMCSTPAVKREKAMYAVIFEFRVRPGRQDEYFKWAERLSDQVRAIDGFLGIERFESRSTEDKFVSLSFFRDAEAVAAWRDNPTHGQAQAAGKTGIFSEFRLRVAEVKREITLDDDGNRTARDLA